MINPARRIFTLLTFIVIFSAVPTIHASTQADVNAPAYWQSQAINNLIPFWEKTIDKDNGGFFTDVEEDGTVSPSSNKYTRMNSRIVYGFCAAYMLSGDDKYLEFAKHGMDFLGQYCFDKENGGWHTNVDESNEPDSGNKNLFDETYGSLGPVFYYLVTRDKDAFSYVKKTHELMQTKAWDKEYGGYYASVGNGWEIVTTNKSFNSQIDTFTAYLLYYYMATKDPAILADLKAAANADAAHMVDPKTSSVGETFSQDWTRTESNLWVGHNLKTGWIMMRMYNLTGDKKYLETAQKIAAAQMKYMWDNKYGGWYFRFLADDPKSYEDQKDWWTQEEGNMLMLNMFNNTRDNKYLDKFVKCAQFWDKNFLDKKNGECYAELTRDGKPMSRKKADSYKSAYHSMEQCLFSYLYLSLYVNKTEATLYFNPSADSSGEKMYVSLLEDKSVVIKSVDIDGKDWKDFSAEDGYITLPAGKKMKVKVIYMVKK